MKFQTEQDSIDFFRNQLEYSGFTSINATQALDQYSFYDISANYKNKKYKFELKRRDMTSEKYGDSVIEFSKYQKFASEIESGEIRNGFVVSFFDDIYTIDSITSTHKIDQKICPTTTEFENNNKKNKWLVHYQQQKKFQY